MLPPDAATNPARSRIKLPLILVILLSVISFVTSYKGLVILNVENDQDLSLWQNIFIAFMVFTIQATLVVTLIFMIQGYRRLTRLLALFVYIVAMLFSVFFSYGWWYEVFRADSYAEEVYKDGVQRIRNKATAYQESFANVREVADNLSAYSTKRARDENLYGGTCDEKSLPGRGALNYLRNSEAKQFKQVASDIEGLETRVGGDIVALNRLLDNLDLSEAGIVAQRERELNDIVARIGRYKNDSVTQRLRTELDRRRGDKRKTLQSRNPRTEETVVVSCLDEEITRQIDALIMALDALPEPRKVILFDQSNNRTVLQRAWEVFASILLIDPSQNNPDQPQIILRSTDYVPLIVGILIDLFILVLGFIDGLEYGRRYTGKHYSHSDAKQLAQFHTQETIASEQLQLLNTYLYRGWFSHYLIAPIAQSIQTVEEQQLLRLIAWLEAHGKIEPFAQAIELEQLPPVMQAFYTADTEQNQWREIWHFDVYRMRKSMWNELFISHAQDEVHWGPTT